MAIRGKSHALGADHPTNPLITGATDWPTGLARLINTTHRIHRCSINSAGCLFYNSARIKQLAMFEIEITTDRVAVWTGRISPRLSRLAPDERVV